MKEITIRQNQYEGLSALRDVDGPMTLWTILQEAFDDTPFDPKAKEEEAPWWRPVTDGPVAVRAAIAPDILASLRDDEDGPREIVQAIIGAISAAEVDPED